jgi:uroporphyrinogen-III synthase
MLKPFAGYRILVTRPEKETQQLCAQLTELGASTIALPLQTRLAEISAPPPNLHQHHGVIVVSPTAAQLAASVIDLNQLHWQPVWLAIGKSTARQLHNLLRVNVLTPEPENSEALLALPMLQADAVKQQHWLLIKGQGGRATIQETLCARGANISIWNLYQREPSAAYQNALQEASACGLDSQVVMVSNAEALQLLVKLLQKHQPTKISELIIVVPGPRLTALARTLGFTQVISSAGAQSDCLIVALQNYLLSAPPQVCDHHP